MIAIGMAFAWLGYSAIYVSAFRLSGDKRSVTDIFMGHSIGG